MAGCIRCADANPEPMSGHRGPVEHGSRRLADPVPRFSGPLADPVPRFSGPLTQRPGFRARIRPTRPSTALSGRPKPDLISALNRSASTYPGLVDFDGPICPICGQQMRYKLCRSWSRGRFGCLGGPGVGNAAGLAGVGGDWLGRRAGWCGAGLASVGGAGWAAGLAGVGGGAGWGRLAGVGGGAGWCGRHCCQGLAVSRG
jgi:hypothetical protein